MAVIIANFDMPNCCEQCSFLDYEQGYCFAYGNGNEKTVPFDKQTTRQRWCPLRSVSEFRLTAYDNNGNIILDVGSDDCD